jgi:phenylalanyl-tRNA synthetase beta chain
VERLHVAGPLAAHRVEIALFTPGRAAELRLGEHHLGYLGEVDPAKLEEFELREACSAAELELDVLLREAVLVAEQRSLPPFPAVVRDLSLVVARDLPWAELSEAVVGSAGPTLEAVDYLDTFRGGNLPEDKQSVHFSMVFRHPERTLTGEEVEAAVQSVVEACGARFNAQLRR